MLRGERAQYTKHGCQERRGGRGRGVLLRALLETLHVFLQKRE